MIGGETVWLTDGGTEIAINKSHRIYEISEEDSETNDSEAEFKNNQDAEQRSDAKATEGRTRNEIDELKDVDSNGNTTVLGQTKAEIRVISEGLCRGEDNTTDEVTFSQGTTEPKTSGVNESATDHESDSESGFDTDLEIDEEMPDNYLQEQKNKYLATCKKIGVPPVTTLLNSLSKRALKLSHQGLGSNGMRAIASVLKVNTSITELDLSDNNIGEEGTKTIARLLRDNLYVSDLDLSFNNLSKGGLQDLVDTLKDSTNIKHLKLSRTGLRDRHVLVVADLIRCNDVILTLALSHNELSVAAGLQLGPAISTNTKIRILDLSWNHIRNDGAIAFGNSLNSNNSITSLNLAWNGFADSGAEAIGKALQVNTSLTELDLSYNRITERGGSHLAVGLRWNSVLKVLKLNWNPLKTDGVTFLIDGLRKNESSALIELQLKGVVIDHACKSAVEELSTRKQGIKIDVGGVTSSGPMFANVNQLRREIVEIIVAYLAKHRLRMLDLFNQWDKDKSLTLTRNEFRKGIKDCKIPITEIQLNFMLDWLDQDGNDEIEYNEFVSITEVE